MHGHHQLSLVSFCRFQSYASDIIMSFRRFVLSIALLASLPGRSLHATPSDTEAWLLVASNISLDPKGRYQLYLETQPRLANDLERVSTVQLRTAVNYAFAEGWSSALGYAWTPLFLDSEYHRIYRDENRIWQGVTFTHQYLGVVWQHRLRQEQRFIEDTDGVAHRSRYQLRASMPISASGDFGITAFEEYMVHLYATTNGPSGGYDRNRVFVGPFWKVGATRYEVGYLGEHAKQFGDDERWVHALLTSVVMAF